MIKIEQAQISGDGVSQNVQLYLNSKPFNWRLISWKWIDMPSGATHDPHWNGVEATWEVPDNYCSTPHVSMVLHGKRRSARIEAAIARWLKLPVSAVFSPPGRTP